MQRITPAILLIVFFAILIGLAAVYGMNRFLARPAPTPVAKEKLQADVLASIDLPVGRVVRSSDLMNLQLTREQFAARRWPEIMMADGKQILNRVVKRPIKKGEPFSPDSFYAEGTGPDIAERLAPGLRAVPLLLPISGIPNAAMPGSLVDIIFRTSPTKDLSIPEVTRVLIQGVEVLAIGDNRTLGLMSSSNAKAENHSVILALSSEQAMQLKVAEGHGEFSLVLRNREEPSGSSITADLTLRELLDLPPPVVPPVPAAPFVAEIYRRGRRETLTFGPAGLISGAADRKKLPPSLMNDFDDEPLPPKAKDQDQIVPPPGPPEPDVQPKKDNPDASDKKNRSQVI